MVGSSPPLEEVEVVVEAAVEEEEVVLVEEEVEEAVVKVTEANPRCQGSEGYSREGCPH